MKIIHILHFYFSFKPIAADTVTVIRHFSKTGKIGKRAKTILEGVERGEHHLYISAISLVEIMYLSEKNRIVISLKDTLQVIDNALNYSIVDLRSDIVKLAEHINIPDIFDRLIVSTAKFLEIALLTCDKRIIEKDYRSRFDRNILGLKSYQD